MVAKCPRTTSIITVDVFTSSRGTSHLDMDRDTLAIGVDGYPLEVGDVVYDRKTAYADGDRGQSDQAVVIEICEGDVHETTFFNGERDVSLADYGDNQQYADFEHSVRAVRIVFASWLDANAPGWRHHTDDILDHIQRRVPSVNFGGISYSYPEARLVPKQYVVSSTGNSRFDS